MQRTTLFVNNSEHTYFVYVDLRNFRFQHPQDQPQHPPLEDSGGQPPHGVAPVIDLGEEIAFRFTDLSLKDTPRGSKASDTKIQSSWVNAPEFVPKSAMSATSPAFVPTGISSQPSSGFVER